jgi:hypothetical protein
VQNLSEFSFSYIDTVFTRDIADQFYHPSIRLANFSGRVPHGADNLMAKDVELAAEFATDTTRGAHDQPGLGSAG